MQNKFLYNISMHVINFSLFLKIYVFLFMVWVWYEPEGMYVYHMYVWYLWKPKEAARSPWAGIAGGCALPGVGSRNQNSGSVQDSKHS